MGTVKPERRRRIGRYFLLSALVILVLFRGGVSQVTVLTSCLLLSVACLIGAMVRVKNKHIRHAMAYAVWMPVLLTLYILVQSLQFDGNILAHLPATRFALLDVSLRSISVDPDASKAAIFPLILPFMFFFASISLCDKEEAAFNLLQVLAIFGGFLAAFGIVQMFLLPDSLLFFKKEYYIGSLTATFVNRNTAGTFMAISSLAGLASAIAMSRKAPTRQSLIAQVFDSRSPVVWRVKIVGFALICLISAHAVFLTKSRGATLSMLVGYMFIIPLLLASNSEDIRASLRKMGWDSFSSSRASRYLMAACGVVVIILFAIAFGGQAMYRLDRQTLDVGRLCLYSATWRAYLDNWIFGTGLGTFDIVFPAYRSEGCGFINSTYIRAHNSYLEGLLTLGLIFVPFIALTGSRLVAVFIYGMRNRIRMRFIPIIGLGGLIMVATHALLDFSIQIPGMAAYFAMFVGATSVLCVQKSRKNEVVTESRASKEQNR